MVCALYLEDKYEPEDHYCPVNAEEVKDTRNEENTNDNCTNQGKRT